MDENSNVPATDEVDYDMSPETDAQIYNDETEPDAMEDTQPIPTRIINDPEALRRTFNEKFPILTKVETYKMMSNPKGLCLIINIIKYDQDAYDEREGADVDAKVTQETFKYLGYEVEYHENLRYQDFRKCVRKFSEDDRHKSCDSAIILLMGHGYLGTIISADGVPFKETDLLQYFNNYWCESLRD